MSARRALHTWLHLVTALLAALLMAGRAAALAPPFIVTENLYFPGVPFRITDVALDTNGDTVIAGVITGFDFPGVDSGQVMNGGAGFRFVARLGASGKAMRWVRPVGLPLPTLSLTDDGSFRATAVLGLALDSAGNAYVVAHEADVARDFPATGGTLQFGHGQKYLYRVSRTGTVTRLATPLDAAIDRVAAITLDPGGAVYLTGTAHDGLATTPFAPYATSAVAAGCAAAFVTRIDAGTGAVRYATYLGYAGTAGYDCVPVVHGYIEAYSVTPAGFAVAVDASGNLYVAGQALPGLTATPGTVDLGTKVTGYRGNGLVFDSTSHAFVVKIDPTGSRIAWAARIGGSLRDRATAIAVDAAGAVLVAGKTSSSDFPWQGTLHRFPPFVHVSCLLSTPEFGFLAKLSSDGSQLLLAGILPMDGHELDDCGNGTGGYAPAKVLLDGAGNIVVAGPTSQSNRDLGVTRDAVMPEPFSGVSGDGSQVVLLLDPAGQLIYSTALPQWNVSGLGIDPWDTIVVGSASGLTRMAEGSMPVVLSLPPVVCAGAPTPIAASVAGANGSGVVEFFVDGASAGTSPVSGTLATRPVTLPLGVHNVKATYHGPAALDGHSSIDRRVPVNQVEVCG